MYSIINSLFLIKDYIVQTTVKKGSCIFFNRKLLHQGEKNYSEKPRAALLLQVSAIIS